MLEHYHWLKYIVGKINSAMNLITGAFIAGNLPFYATNVFEVFGDGIWIELNLFWKSQLQKYYENMTNYNREFKKCFNLI